MTGVVTLSPEAAAALPGPAVSLPTMGAPAPSNVVEITRPASAAPAPAATPAAMPMPEAPDFGAGVEARFEARFMARTMGILPSAPEPQAEQQQQQEPAQPDTFLGRLGAMLPSAESLGRLPTPQEVAQHPPRPSIIGGAMRDTAQGAVDLATELGQWTGLVDRGVKINLGDVRPAEAHTAAGRAANAGHEMARGLAAFAMPFGAASRMLHGMGLGRYAATMFAGGAADLLQDPEQGNLSTLARDLGIENEVTSFLDSRVGDDAGAEERLRARLKQVVEGAGAGLVIEGLIGILRHAPRAAAAAVGAAAMAPGEAEAGPLDRVLRGALHAAPDASRGGRAMTTATETRRGVDPERLIFREAEQHRVDDVASMFPAGEGYPPVVVADTVDGPLILDGHNRAVVARRRGERLDAVAIPGEVYLALKARGLDEVDIAHAALERAGEHDAASAVRQQFPGVRFDYSEKEADAVFDEFEAKAGAGNPRPLARGGQ
jgi:hypothetical protein